MAPMFLSSSRLVELQWSRDLDLLRYGHSSSAHLLISVHHALNATCRVKAANKVHHIKVGLPDAICYVKPAS